MSDKSKRAELERGQMRRAYPVQLEVRSQAGPRVTLDGYASATEQPYEMWDMFGSYSEIVRSGSFGKTLSENPQTQLLLNHGGLSMAYTRAGTLRLGEDSSGLHMSADVNTARSDVRDMVTAIEDGAVDEMSFAFRTTRQQWSPDYDQRDILEVDIHRGDVSVVNFGANPATSVAPSVRAADVRAMAQQLRAPGGGLTPATMLTLQQVLTLTSVADDAVDEIQMVLAELLGVPNPDDDASAEALGSDLSLYLARAAALGERKTA